MKVLHVTRTFTPALGGMEEAIRNLVMHQKRAGIDVRILTLDRPAGSGLSTQPLKEMIAGIPVRRMSWFGSARYPFAPQTLRLLGDAQLIHVHAIDSFFDVLAWSWPMHRRALIASTHGGFFHTRFMRRAKTVWFHTVTRASVKFYDGIIASSENDAVTFSRLSPRLLETIENGVDIQKWAGRGASSQVKHIIYFGRFASHKRIESLFHMLRALRAKDNEWRLTVAGSPADVSAVALRSAAADLGEAVSIEVRPDASQLAELIGRASYYACASSYEGFGIAAVEALSAGLLPVLSRIAPFIRLTRDLDEAILFDPTDPNDAASRLLALHEQLQPRWPEIRHRMMDAAKPYAWEHVAAAHSAFYVEALRRAQLKYGRLQNDRLEDLGS